MSRDATTLFDIVRAISLTQSFIADTSFDLFVNDLKTQSAVLYQLLVLGEAVKRLSPELRSQHPTVPWSLIVGMRNHLIHGYDVVDWTAVWHTLTRDLPLLHAQLEVILPASD